VRPHELIIHWFHDEGGLFDENTFRGDKTLINHIGIPFFRRGISDQLIDFLKVGLRMPRSKNLVPILPCHPIVILYVNIMTITHSPAATVLDGINSLKNALPSIAGISALLSMENVRIRIILSLGALTKQGGRISLESPDLLG
jgi:hypothetical protein